MRKSKILGIALAAAMVSSIAVTAAFSASAVELKGKPGITGSFANWGNPYDDGTVVADIPMTETSAGIWEGTIQIDNVTEDMLGEATMDDGEGTQIPRTDITGKAITFKVRCDNAWTDSWGDYEAAYNRTWNSQTNCAVAAEAGKPITIKVKFDTTTIVDQSQIEDEEDRYPEGSSEVWPVTYEVVASEEPASEKPAEEPASEEPASEKPAEEPASEEPASEKPAEEPKEDTTPVETGDAASAAALVAVVLASLGTAVVMTKKASAKD